MCGMCRNATFQGLKGSGRSGQFIRLLMNEWYQVRLQKEIDSILGDSDHNRTSYEAHFDAFSSGWIAAVMAYFPAHSLHNYHLRARKNSLKLSASFPE